MSKCEHPGRAGVPIAWACALCHAEWGAVDKLIDENEKLRAALTIDREEVGRIMHDSWRRTKESQGFHRPPPREEPCYKCHTDMVPWNELPEHQKDINRHAFDDVLSEIQRRAALGDAP